MMTGHFRIDAEAELARAGSLRLPRGGEVKTPLFMPVATKLTVKTLSSGELASTGTEAVITNGFLSSLEPGSDVIRSMGGMHSMMDWGGGIFSDSGGFQLIRKGFEPRIKDEGARMRSPFSGERVHITPESVVEMHVKHGVDVGMVLDHCPPHGASGEDLVIATGRTRVWAERSRVRIDDEGLRDLLPVGGGKMPLFFAITQGGIDLGLRERSTRDLVGLGFDGYGIGGLSIGEDKEDMFKALGASTSFVPRESPRYFMGVGEPRDVIRSVGLGVDIFDSVFPTRNARHRSVFVAQGRENIRSGRWKGKSGPIMDGCDCLACSRYSRGYLYHLFKAKEPLGPMLATIHNVRYMQNLVLAIRASILEGRFSSDLEPVDLLGAG